MMSEIMETKRENVSPPSIYSSKIKPEHKYIKELTTTSSEQQLPAVVKLENVSPLGNIEPEQRYTTEMTTSSSEQQLKTKDNTLPAVAKLENVSPLGNIEPEQRYTTELTTSSSEQQLKTTDNTLPAVAKLENVSPLGNITELTTSSSEQQLKTTEDNNNTLSAIAIISTETTAGNGLENHGYLPEKDTMPVDPMDDIELRSVQLQFPHARGSIIDACDQRRIPTDKGDILVAIQGDTTKPAILTYHDLGLNYATSFAGFFNYPLMRGLLENFCVYHVTAPGQEEGAPTLPEDYIYPTMDELASQLQFVLSHFGLKMVVGFGIGAGANILARFALSHPDKVGAMCLINCVSTQSGWIEWGYQSFNARYLRTKGMTQGVIDYLMWHHFGRNPEERNHDLVQMYKQHFERGINPTNLAMFINSYIHRNDLNISRTPPGTPGTEPSASTLKMPIMNITGALSPHVDDTVTFNGRLDPTNSTWMKISDCAMVLEEQPAKLAEAFRLFLQGEGYAVGSLQKLARKLSTISQSNSTHVDLGIK